MKIWHRYLLRQMIANFLFILMALFSIYVLIDLSVNGVRFSRANGTEIVLYYMYSLAGHLDLFFPLAFMLTTLKVLFELMGRFELLSLQMAGLSLKRILGPFFLFGSLLSIGSYANHQWLAPEAIASSKEFKMEHTKKKGKVRKQLQTIVLSDSSEIVYNEYADGILSDVFWIRGDIWHMKTLDLDGKKGFFVDHLVLKEGKLLKKESFEEKVFSDLPITKELAETPFIPYESRTLSSLLRDYPFESADKACIRTHLHHKLSIPLLSILLLMALSPFALVYSRTRSPFLIFSLSLVLFIAIMTLFDSLLILGENQIMTPWIAMWIVPALIFSASIRKFAKL